MDAKLRSKLELAARRAAGYAYCPYSGFRVGAAVVGETDQVYTGCNVENASFGLTICAERNAIFQLIADGGRSITAIVVYTPTATPAAPCGACRQVIQELGPDAEIISICDGPKALESTIHELLPSSFASTNLGTPNRLLDAGFTGQLPKVKERPRLCIDIDNVVARSDEVMRQVIYEVTKGRVDLAYEDVKCFNYWECKDRRGNSITKDEWKAVHDLFSEPRFLRAIRPVDGIQDHLQQLAERFSLHFATSRLAKARKHTVEWLEQHAFPTHDLHFLKHREKHVSLGRFAVAVEDDLDQAEAFADAEVVVSYVLAHPWNSTTVERGNLHRVKDWVDLIRDINDRGLSPAIQPG